MKYYYIYKITCTAGYLKDKYYFGQHTTNNLDDGYKGSGVIIQKYYKKHPYDYIKEIIGFYNSSKELDKAEYNIINDVLNDPNCLNIAAGGHGGYTGHHTEETKKKLSESHKGMTAWNKGKKMGPMSEEQKKKYKGRKAWNKGKKMGPMPEEIKERHKGYAAWNKGLKGCFSEETIRKMSESHKRK